jgi:hypothetical protein
MLERRLDDWDSFLSGGSDDAHTGPQHSHSAKKHQRLVIGSK